jgi:hypothetical protein
VAISVVLYEATWGVRPRVWLRRPRSSRSRQANVTDSMPSCETTSWSTRRRTSITPELLKAAFERARSGERA